MFLMQFHFALPQFIIVKNEKYKIEGIHKLYFEKVVTIQFFS